MSEPDAVETVAKARRLSLIKWTKVKVLYGKLFNEIDTSCGFCDLGRHRALMAQEKCKNCGVETRCEAILDVISNIGVNLENVIDGTLTFLREMDVTEK